ncbi:MAG: signal peptidase I [Firmicutes bacterium]|nr:signal peptidase I [Bacillota bacterium]
MKFLNMLKEWGIIIITAIVMAFLIQTFIFDTRIVPSLSMYPTIEKNDRLINSKLSYIFGEVQRGDIVVFKAPESTGLTDDLVKRVIALPGETFEVKEGAVYINGTKLDEPYLQVIPTYTYAKVTVPENCYIMLGDNRNASIDSHMWSDPFLHKDYIIGKAICRYWPFDRLGWLN